MNGNAEPGGRVQNAFVGCLAVMDAFRRRPGLDRPCLRYPRQHRMGRAKGGLACGTSAPSGNELDTLVRRWWA